MLHSCFASTLPNIHIAPSFVLLKPYTLAAGALWNVVPCDKNELTAVKEESTIEAPTFSMLVASSGTAAAMSCLS